MSDQKARPTHGCYTCRRDVAKTNRDSLRLVLEQHGCDPYPDFDVCVYECVACGGLWLRTIKPGCIMNLREDDAIRFFPGIKLGEIPG